jgi:uncharacterized repeat protein (TIGR02543 family)
VVVTRDGYTGEIESDPRGPILAITAHAVTFNTNGGSTVNPTSVIDGEKVGKPLVDPTKQNYEFDNWYADEELNTLFDFDAVITGDTTVYAGWKPLSAITVTLKPTVNPALTATEITLGETREFDAGSYSSYQWYLDGELIPLATNQTYTLDTASMKQVTYELSVLVSTSTEEMLSARCRVIVK